MDPEAENAGPDGLTVMVVRLSGIEIWKENVKRNCLGVDWTKGTEVLGMGEEMFKS